MPRQGLRVTIWNEHVREREDARVAAIYPAGIHGALAAALAEHRPGDSVVCSTLADPDQGLGDDRLDETDVLMGTACMLRWREAGDRCVMWTVESGHPLAAGVPNPLVIPADEMYCEPFGIPAPDELVFVSSYSGGEVLRSGCCFRRGSGRIVYLSPGHEPYPVYHQDGVRRLIANAVGWAAAPRRWRRRSTMPSGRRRAGTRSEQRGRPPGRRGRRLPAVAPGGLQAPGHRGARSGRPRHRVGAGPSARARGGRSRPRRARRCDRRARAAGRRRSDAAGRAPDLHRAVEPFPRVESLPSPLLADMAIHAFDQSATWPAPTRRG